MGMPRRTVFGCALLAVCIASQSAQAILMPPGSTVWMEFKGSAGPDNDGDDIAASNRAGPTPLNGIPLTTMSNSFATATGYAEILPDRVRTFIRSDFSAFMHASFQDTYTVTGAATGTFDIPVSLRVTGMMRSMPHGTFGHVIIAASVQAEIGTFFPLSESGGSPVLEQFRIQPFDAASQAITQFVGPDALPSPYEVPVDITATYTVQDVAVGDTFVLAYGVNSAFSKGEIDLRNTGSVSFALPAGVTLTSALAQAIPEPASAALLALAAASLLRRKRGGIPS